MKFHASDADEIAAALSDAMSRSIGYRPHVLTRVGPSTRQRDVLLAAGSGEYHMAKVADLPSSAG